MDHNVRIYEVEVMAYLENKRYCIYVDASDGFLFRILLRAAI